MTNRIMWGATALLMLVVGIKVVLHLVGSGAHLAPVTAASFIITVVHCLLMAVRRDS